MTAKAADLIAIRCLLEEIRAYLDDRADVNYEGTGPNKAMSLLQDVDEVLPTLPEPTPVGHVHQCQCFCPKGDCTRPVACVPTTKPGCPWPVCSQEFPHRCDSCAGGDHATAYNIAAPALVVPATSVLP
jgi:hypothetical protein